MARKKSARLPAEGRGGSRRSRGRTGGRPEAARAAGGREPAAAAVEQSSDHAGGGRRLGGTHLKFVKTSGTLL